MLPIGQNQHFVTYLFPLYFFSKIKLSSGIPASNLIKPACREYPFNTKVAICFQLYLALSKARWFDSSTLFFKAI
jgi:hypothetical protein